MKISARNVFKGKVADVRPGRVNTEVVIDVPGGLQVVAMISKDRRGESGAQERQGRLRHHQGVLGDGGNRLEAAAFSDCDA